MQNDASLRFGGLPAASAPFPINRIGKFMVEPIEGVTFRVERTIGPGIQYTITEKHDAKETVQSLRILADPMPDKARTSFYPDDSMVVREYTYDKRREERPA